MSYPCARQALAMQAPAIDFRVHPDTPFPPACPAPGPGTIDLTEVRTFTHSVPTQSTRVVDLRARSVVDEVIIDDTPTESIPQVALARLRD